MAGTCPPVNISASVVTVTTLTTWTVVALHVAFGIVAALFAKLFIFVRGKFYSENVST